MHSNRLTHYYVLQLNASLLFWWAVSQAGRVKTAPRNSFTKNRSPAEIFRRITEQFGFQAYPVSPLPLTSALKIFQTISRHHFPGAETGASPPMPYMLTPSMPASPSSAGLPSSHQGDHSMPCGVCPLGSGRCHCVLLWVLPRARSSAASQRGISLTAAFSRSWCIIENLLRRCVT